MRCFITETCIVMTKMVLQHVVMMCYDAGDEIFALTFCSEKINVPQCASVQRFIGIWWNSMELNHSRSGWLDDGVGVSLVHMDQAMSIVADCRRRFHCTAVDDVTSSMCCRWYDLLGVSLITLLTWISHNFQMRSLEMSCATINALLELSLPKTEMLHLTPDICTWWFPTRRFYAMQQSWCYTALSAGQIFAKF